MIPEFRAPELTDRVLADLFADDAHVTAAARVVVVDNGGDYRSQDERVAVYRPGSNSRWIGATNWALNDAAEHGEAVCVVLNNDVRLSPRFLTGIVAPFAECDDVAVVAACYDDFWLHQRASSIPDTAADYVPAPVCREVPFCDGTAIAFSVSKVTALGGLDQTAFPAHGYGSDLDLALRARAAGLRCLVTEQAYVSHLRRATMARVGQSAEENRAEILIGMDGKWGPGWRARLGLGPGAFPPHNTGSAASWYLRPPHPERPPSPEQFKVG